MGKAFAEHEKFVWENQLAQKTVKKWAYSWRAYASQKTAVESLIERR